MAKPLTIRAATSEDEPAVVDLWRVCGLLESPGFAHEFGSCGEAEVLHLAGVLTFDDEFREDVVFGGIQEKFRQTLA